MEGWVWLSVHARLPGINRRGGVGCNGARWGAAASAAGYAQHEAQPPAAANVIHTFAAEVLHGVRREAVAVMRMTVCSTTLERMRRRVFFRFVFGRSSVKALEVPVVVWCDTQFRFRKCRWRHIFSSLLFLCAGVRACVPL